MICLKSLNYFLVISLSLVVSHKAYADPVSVRFGNPSPGSDCLYSPLFPTFGCYSNSTYHFGSDSPFSGSPLSNPFRNFDPKTPPKKPQKASAPAVPAAKAPAVLAPPAPQPQAPPPPAAAPAPVQPTIVTVVQGGTVTSQASDTGPIDVLNAFGGGRRQAPAPVSNLAQPQGNSGEKIDVLNAFGGGRRSPPAASDSSAVGQPQAPVSAGEKINVLNTFGGGRKPPPAAIDSSQGSQIQRGPVENIDVLSAFGGGRRPAPAPKVDLTKSTDQSGIIVPVPLPQSKPTTNDTIIIPQGNVVAVPDVPPKLDYEPAQSFPVRMPGPIESHPLDAGQLAPQTPILPTAKNLKELEVRCPKCLDPGYQGEFKALQDIRDRLPGVDSVLRTAAHNMMKIVHMRCDANDIFVPSDYVTNLVYCEGKKPCDRMSPRVTDTYSLDQIARYKGDQKTGDTYRAPLSSEVAGRRVSTSKNDTRTCKDLYDRPFMFNVGGHATYTKDVVDPFNYKAQGSMTGQAVNLFDCASSINAVFAAAGLKFSSKDTTSATAYNKSTGALVSLAYAGAKDKTSCVSIPDFKADETIHSGDVYVIHRNVNGKAQDIGHALMFDDVKEDPFNLAGITRPEDCSTQIEPSKFRFSILQSSGTAVDRQVFEKFKGIDLTIEQHFDKFNAVNPEPCTDYSNSSTCDFRERFEDWGAHILQMAKKACLAKTNPQKSYRPGEPLLARDKAKINGKEYPVNISGVLMRHKGATEGCSFAKPPEVIGAKCVAECLEK